jgi:hypothetical protein
VGTTLNVTGVATFSAAPIYSSLTASNAVATDASKALVSVTNTGTGNNVLATSPTLVTPILGTPQSGSLVNCTDTNYTGFKNRIINGAMVIDQRNAGASLTINTSQPYTLDRWVAFATVTSKYSVQQNAAAVTPPAGFKNYLGVTSLAATSLGAGDYYFVCQKIEGYNCADLGFGAAGASTVTVSFWVRSSLTGTFGGALNNGDFSRAYPFTYTINAANTWEQKTVTIAGDTSGTWDTTNGKSIIVIFGLGVGSTGSGTAGSWSSNAYFSATGATSVVGTNGATFYITGVQLEKGSTATSFDYRPYGTELALCQRYYQQSYAVGLVAGDTSGLGLVGGTAMNNGANSAGNNGLPISFKTPMRATATVTTYAAYANSSASITIAKASTPSATYAATADLISSNGFKVYSTATGSGGTAGTATEFLLQYFASAEL